MYRLFDMLRERGHRRTLLSVQKDNSAVVFIKDLSILITDDRLYHANHEDYTMIKELGVNLREWKIEDAPYLVAAINNKKVLDNLRDGIPYPYTEKDAEDFIGSVLNTVKNMQYVFAIAYNGKAVGTIGVYRKDNIHRLTGELGYYIAEAYWGKGIATEAVRQMCGYIFENTDIVRIFAEPYAHNEASCRVLEKAGFRFEGTLLHNAIKNGQLMDMKMYANIKQDKGRGDYGH